MRRPSPACPDCDSADTDFSRRDFIKTASAVAASAAAVGSTALWTGSALAAPAPNPPETTVKNLYETLTPAQKEKICFAWDYNDPKRGLLRTRISNNWHITEPQINGDFYTKDQQQLIRHIYEGIIDPDWHSRIDKQLEDDAGGFGNDQNIAIFGTPGSNQFELVMTGRHMTIRCDGNTTEHVAFGGPLFYGHAADGFNEKPNHPGNVFWPQAVAANKVYEMLDGKQRERALVEKLPAEEAVNFRGTSGGFPGMAVADMSSDQKELVQQVLQKLVAQYRLSDREEALACLKTQGGLDKCSLAFYKEGDLGDDKVWDCWRLEGPSLIWYFRGAPHVHVWVNVADSADVKLNA